MRVLLTGAAGFVGRVTLDLLEAVLKLSKS